MQIAEQTAKQNLGLESAPHLHAPLTTNAIMLLVLLALIPGFAVAVYFFGGGLILHFLVSALTALVCEALVALLRHRSVKRALTDRSALVTAALLALTIPPLLPWHLTVTATVFAILIVKHAFGGLGMNIFNPAMAGFIFLVISAPGVFYDTWLTPAPAAISVVTPDRAAGVIFMGDDPRVMYREVVALKEDAHTLTGATFLESVKTARKAGEVEMLGTTDFTSDDYVAYLAMALALALGGLFLMVKKVILYQMPLTFLITLTALGYIWHSVNPGASITMTEHLLFGGSMLGAFFIITDPVTTCGTARGRILFAALTAFLVILIRIHGSYSDSVAFAVLLANAAAPLIDVITKRRPFGIGYRKGGLQ